MSNGLLLKSGSTIYNALLLSDNKKKKWCLNDAVCYIILRFSTHEGVPLN